MGSLVKAGMFYMLLATTTISCGDISTPAGAASLTRVYMGASADNSLFLLCDTRITFKLRFLMPTERGIKEFV